MSLGRGGFQLAVRPGQNGVAKRELPNDAIHSGCALQAGAPLQPDHLADAVSPEVSASLATHAARVKIGGAVSL